MRTVWWEDGAVRMVDQRKLPSTVEILTFHDYRDVAEAIRNMSVRGAPAIGATGALGLALAARQYQGNNVAELRAFVETAAGELAGTRPTAVNLFWGLDRMRRCLLGAPAADAATLREALLEEAQHIAEEDVETNRRLGAHGADLIADGDSVLTHCNAGALACVDHGTALGVIRAAWAAGKRIHMFVDETRPLLQGARLTAWELTEAGIPMTLITDNMAGHFMKAGKVNCVVVGADRIAANGDTANKIGTYGVAVLAKENNVPFYVAAPLSTVDLTLASGDAIPIEERRPEEVTGFGGVRWAPKGVRVANPAFDVTPNRYVRGIITEVGVLRPPYTESLCAAVERGRQDGR